VKTSTREILWRPVELCEHGREATVVDARLSNGMATERTGRVVTGKAGVQATFEDRRHGVRARHFRRGSVAVAAPTIERRFVVLARDETKDLPLFVSEGPFSPRVRDERGVAVAHFDGGARARRSSRYTKAVSSQVEACPERHVR
jgi:hypothetical protein